MTPDVIDSDVQRLIRLMDAKSRPVYIDVTPEPYAEVVECFPAVQEKISRDGGTQELGWQIWKTNLIVEAEFHAVWKSPDGELRDITPKQIRIPRILFLPDPAAVYNGASVDNIRINITDNKLVDEFIDIAKAIFRIENRGERAFQYKLSLSGREAQLYSALQQTKAEVLALIRQGGTRNSQCFCQSGNKYKHCHGKGLRDVLERI